MASIRESLTPLIEKCFVRAITMPGMQEFWMNVAALYSEIVIEMEEIEREAREEIRAIVVDPLLATVE